MSPSHFSLTIIKTTILDLLFPYRCARCGTEGQMFCESCLLSQRRPSPPLCRSCGIPIGLGEYCRHCANESYSFDSVRSCFIYEGAVRDAIMQFKYRGVTDFAPVLGTAMNDTLTQWSVRADLIMPVPLHTSRFRERGYNQAALLAQVIAQQSGIDLDESTLIRDVATPPQAKSRNREERRLQMENTFQCGDPERVVSKRVILVDDVCTTGATLNACAKALKGAGARTAWGLTLARDL
ncbi:MAG: ComF family protein [Dehalococcoidia bacterium]|nr:ComF family protein [Dehalococcoidia bacterium]